MPLPRLRTDPALAWGAVLCLALGAWLAVPRERAGRGAPLHAVLVDVSKSAVATRAGSWRDAVRAALEQARADAARDGADLVLACFGRGARWAADADGLLDPAAPRGEDASDLAAGLSLCAVPRAGATLSRILVVGDGTFTGADPAPVAARLASTGVRIERADLPQAALGSAAVDPLPSPIAFRRGVPFEIEARVRWCSTDAAEMRVEGRWSTPDGRVGRGETRVAVGPDRGSEARVRLRLPALDAARADLEIRATLHAGDGRALPDPVPEDDAARAGLVARGVTTVGAWGSTAERDALHTALGAWPADLDLVAADPARDLAGIDVLITVDAALDASARARVAGFVRAGGGWIDLAGWRWTTSTRPDVAALVPAGADRAPRDVVALVDASGSMAGAPSEHARAALADMIESAPVEDALRVRFFAGDVSAPIELGAAGERADPARRRELARRLDVAPEPRGPTRLWPALDAVAAQAVAGRETLLILVSDGRDPERAGLADRARRARERLSAARVRLAVIVTGADPDREVLAALGDDELLEAGDLGRADGAARLARLFARVAAADRVRAGDALAVARSTGAHDIAAALLDLAPPTLRRAARARAVDAQTVWLVDGEPVLAVRRAGLGVSAGLAVVPADDWVGDLGPVRAALFSLLRTVAPPEDRARPRLVERDGELVLENAPPGAPAILPARLRSRAGDDLGTVELLGAAPGHDPIAARAVALPAAFARLGAGETLTAEVDAGPPAGRITLDFAAPRASEFARTPGGFTPPPPAAPAAGGAPAPHPAAPAFLIAGLAALAVSAGRGFFSRSRG